MSRCKGFEVENKFDSFIDRRFNEEDELERRTGRKLYSFVNYEKKFGFY